MSDIGFDPCALDEPGVIDLGHEVRMKFTGTYGDETAAQTGLIESHPDGQGGRCCGGITFDVPQASPTATPRWTVESLDPLTLSPSLLCRACGHHGFIRDGRWVPA